MDNRRDERINVAHNVLLLDRRAAARGCRMQDVSTLGMALRCKNYGDGHFLHIGDQVNIHVSVGDAGNRRSRAVTATVRRVEGDRIGVEFLHPEHELVALIDTYLKNHASSPELTMTSTPAATASPSPARGQANPLLLGALSLALVLVAVLAIYTQSRVAALDTRVQVLTSSTEKNTVALRDIRSRMTAISNQGEELDDLRSGMQELKSSLEDFRSRYLVDTQPDTPAAVPAREGEPEPRPAATRPGADSQPGTDAQTAAVAETPDTAAEDSATEPAQEPASRAETEQPSPGPWVINIASTADQDAAQSYARDAVAKGIPVEVNPVASGDRRVYRLQVTGFASRDAARRYGETVKDTLNLKELWIFKTSGAKQE